MKLLTKEIKKKLPPLYTHDGNYQAPVVVKFFTPDSGWAWWATEACAIVPNDGPDADIVPYKHMQVLEAEKAGVEIEDVEFFGLVDGHDAEMGYFRLSELESVRGRFGLPVERDMHWDDSTTIGELLVKVAGWDPERVK